MKQKQKSRGRVLLSLLFGALLLCLASCSDNWTWTKSTWTFENSAAGVSRIEVTPKGNADCGTFTLYYGQSKKVTWKNDGENHYNYSYSPANLVYPVKYDALREICFYRK